MKKMLATILVLLALAAGNRASAEDSLPLGEWIGIGKTIADITIGDVKIYPAYAIEQWRYSWMAKTTNGIILRSSSKLKRSLVTGTYFYSWSSSGPGYSTNGTTPFPINSVDRYAGTCQWGLVDYGSTETYLCDHKIVGWISRIEKTGLWPDHGPWTFYVKTTGNKMKHFSSGCFYMLQPQWNFWAEFSLTDSGHDIKSIGNPNCHLNYPYALGPEFYSMRNFNSDLFMARVMTQSPSSQVITDGTTRNPLL